MRVAEAHNAMPVQQRHHGVTTAATTEQRLQCGKHCGRREELRRAQTLQFAGKNIQQDFGV